MRLTPCIFPTLLTTAVILTGCAEHAALAPAVTTTLTTEVIVTPKPQPFKKFKSLGMLLTGTDGAWNISTDTSGLTRLASLKIVQTSDTNKTVVLYGAEFSRGTFQKQELENALGYLFKVDPSGASPPVGFEDFKVMQSSHKTDKADETFHCGLMKSTDTSVIYLQVSGVSDSQKSACEVEGLITDSLPKTNDDWSHGHTRFLAALLNTVGLKNLEDTAYDKAQQRFQEALAVDSTTPEYLGNRAMLYASRSNAVEGISLMLHYPRLVESSGQLCGLLGAFYEEIGQYSQAKEWAEKALAKDPDNHEWVINLSDALWALGERVQSRNVLLKPYSEKPDVRLGIYLAGTYLGLEEYENARQVLERVHADTLPTAKSAEYALRAGLGLKRYEDGLEFIRKTGTAFPYTAENWLLKATCEFHLNLYRQSLESLRQSLLLDSTDRDAQELQTQIAALMGDKSNQLLRTTIPPLPTKLTIKQTLKEWQDSAWDVRLTGYPILLASQHIVHEWTPQGRWKQTRHAFFIVPDGSKLIRFSELIFNFNSSYERFCVNRFRIYDSTGARIHEGRIEDYYITKNPDEDSHPENLLAHVTLKTVPGRMIVELLTTREAQVSSTDFPYVHFEQNAGYPVLHSRFEILHPSANLILSPYGETKIDTLPDRVAFNFPVPAFPVEDRFSPALENYGSGFSASPFATWKEVGLHYLEDLKKAGIEISRPPLRVRECASEIIPQNAAQRPSENPLKPIFRYVRDSIRYDNHEFSVQAAIPDSGPQVLVKGSADCKGQSLLLTQLLRARGIEAHLALVNLSRIGEAALPHINQFNHMIVYVPKQRDIEPCFLDPTQKFSAFRTSPRGLEGHNALILDPANPQLVSIPTLDSVGENSVRIFHTLEVLRDENTEGHDSIVLDGKAAAEFREQLNAWSVPYKRQNLLSWLSSSYANFHEESFQILNEANVDSPLVLTLHYRGRFPHLENGQPFDYFPKLELSFMRLPEAEHRKAPLYFSHEVRVESNWSYHLPPGFAWKSISLARQLEQSHLHWKFTIQQTKPEDISLQQKWQIQPFAADAEEYRKLRSDWEPIFHYCGLRMAISHR